MRRLARRIALFLAVIVAAVAIAAVLIGSSTGYEERGLAYVGRPGDSKPPTWTTPCRRRSQRYQVSYNLPCGRVEGVVIYRQSHDPDNDGDVHAVVQGASHLVIVKSTNRLGRNGGLPGTGHRLTRVGTVTKGRFGLPVLDVRRSRKSR